MLVLALLAMVAASSVIHAASATSMPVTMAHADHTEPADCEGCDGGEDSDIVCDFACTAPFLAGLVEDRSVAPTPAVTHIAQPAGMLRGRTGAPDPHPPRHLVAR